MNNSFKNIRAHNLLILLSIFIAFGIVYLSPRMLIMLSLIVIAVICYYMLNQYSRIYLILLAINFPIYLRFSGRDAITTGSLLILAMFSHFMTKQVIMSKHKSQPIEMLHYWIILVAIAIFGTIFGLPKVYLGPGLRHLMNFISSISLFILIINISLIPRNDVNNKEFPEKLLFVILLFIFLQIIISFLIYIDPKIGSLFSIFLPRDKESLEFVTYTSLLRGRSIILSPESMGELIAITLPFALYKYNFRSQLYGIIIIFMAAGLFISNTRSGYILAIFNIIAYYWFQRGVFFSKKTLIALCLFLIGVFILLSTGQGLIGSAHTRFVRLYDNIERKRNLVEIVNRDDVWPSAISAVKKSISLFGNGQAPPFKTNFTEKHFHSLYLSLIFNFGIIGAIVFCWLLFTLVKSLILAKYQAVTNREYMLVMSSLMFILTFLINEIKFEFIRYDSYQQIIFSLFGIVYIIGRQSTSE